MHPVLCIDEILQLIFDFCGDLPETKPKWTYAQLARCCKTWTEPALNRLWRRMDGLGPLLALLPKEDKSTVNVSPVFEAYAARVRQVVYTEGLSRVPLFKLSNEHGLNVFPNLESATLINDGCIAPLAWTTSPRLKCVAINLGYSRKGNSVLDRNVAVARYLLQLPHLHTLRLRGRMSDALNAALASLTQLRSLTVSTDDSLDCGTLAAIATFPALRTLEVHASHICAEQFEDALVRISGMDTACFPALEELSIRTNPSLLAALLARLPAGVLRKLDLDMDDGSAGQQREHRASGTYMRPVFELIAQKAAGSLRDLLLEDRAEHEDAVQGETRGARRGYALDVLSPLARVRRLRQFTLKEPDLLDKDLETMARWWPALERLDLGTVEWCTADADVEVAETETETEDEDETESGEPDETKESRMTLAAYAIVARSFRFLETLALTAPPPTAMATTEESARFVTELRSLTVGVSAKCAKMDAPAVVVDALLSIFPALKIMDCPNAEVTERFETVLAGRRRVPGHD